jgi:hypothetical protein
MKKTEHFNFYIPIEMQGEYLTVPFQMPKNVEEFHLTYHYPLNKEEEFTLKGGLFKSTQRMNIIDLGLIGPDGEQVGASGSDKTAFFIREDHATPGYIPHTLTPGEWKILVGAYKVAAEGVNVAYDLVFSFKERQLLIGDIHTHTIASDGVLSAEALALHAERHGLDFLAITDHNQMINKERLQGISDITLIQGIEWTHYQGHANFLGVDRPYDGPFFTHTDEEVYALFQSARERGALIIINHPCDPTCGFHFDMEALPFDCLEIWNGPMRESNLQAVALWQSQLKAGKRIPAVGGSDYHRDELFQILGGPCMGVYAMANMPSDILLAIKAGHSFIRFSPLGPELQLRVGEAIMGDTVEWQEGMVLEVDADGLNKDDILRVISQEESTNVFQASQEGAVNLKLPVSSPGFVRVEIYRHFLPGLPPLPALISNPIYFE